MDIQRVAKFRGIPSLDGLRAVSILLVLVGHSNEVLSPISGIPAVVYLSLAHTGVLVFFVISGFLITSLLLEELEKSGTIRLKRFYLRRAFRIFPAFYVYLAVIFILALVGIIHMALSPIFFAGVYATNYYLGPGAGFAAVQHIWSLSTEEQFYLLWPAALLVLGRRRSVYFAAFLIFISPFSRLVTYKILAPQARYMVDRMFHSNVDTIMFGCLLALLWKSDRFNRWLHPLMNLRTGSWIVGGSAIFLTFLDPFLDYHFRGAYSLLVGMTLEGSAICLIMLYVVKRPKTLAGRILNAPAMRHIGVLSYSIYLWQNIIIAQAGRYFPLDLIAVIACAELSYWAIERPSLRLRDRVQKWFASRTQFRSTLEPCSIGGGDQSVLDKNMMRKN